MVYTERTTWTAADLVALPDGYHYELVKGRLIQMAPTTADHGEASSDLGVELGIYARAHGGHTYAAETGFNLTYPGEAEETVLAPDASYIADAIVPRDPHGFVGRAPDVAAEVASPTQWRPKMADKARLWLARGCKLVWVVWPRYQTIDTPNEVRATLDALEGYAVKYDEGTEDWLATVSDARDPTYGPWTSVRMGKGGDHPQADTPQPISFKSGSTELIVRICERLSHCCGPLIIYPDSGHEVPILVTPGIDPVEAVREWLARE